MMPSMKQRVIALLPVFDSNGKVVRDEFGRPLNPRKVESKARVQFKSQLVQDAQGQEHRVALEIDIPPDFNPDAGIEIEYQMIDGRTAKGVIRAKDEAVNLTGSKVYYRTVFVDG
ncbi:hypothetical protein B481_1998 [Planococcus halocryophilus Or1]|uniref:Uncharacterized protein n=1 Tax=Planococcus halocryophilus TaxID=1215089 RepID=A0A1C7DPX6_9BACL|nr:hypothetical protein [Planococcus halocryophilus]ANU13467.1 hypothetical protein BBI08_06255 [Planococcus halocryophilus]EMF46271.1 hypothetical protein B481_1998 [Planococcus halocryophilus Or1]